MANEFKKKYDEMVKAISETVKKKIENMRMYTVWLSYDLGLGEEAENVTVKRYRQLYAQRYEEFMKWLAGRDALECGKSVALFSALSDDPSKLLDSLKNELTQIGIVGNGIRIYAIVSEVIKSRDENGQENLIDIIDFAGFIIGNRGKAAWEEKPKRKYDGTDIALH